MTCAVFLEFPACPDALPHSLGVLGKIHDCSSDAPLPWCPDSCFCDRHLGLCAQPTCQQGESKRARDVGARRKTVPISGRQDFQAPNESHSLHSGLELEGQRDRGLACLELLDRVRRLTRSSKYPQHQPLNDKNSHVHRRLRVQKLRT